MQEGTLTWSLQRNSLPLSALWAQGPLRAYSFLALNFCIIFRDAFLHSFYMYFWWMLTSILAPCWRHFQCFLHDFFKYRFYIELSSILRGSVCNFWSIVVDFHGPTSNWRKPQKHLFLQYCCIGYTFAYTCFFIIFETCFAAFFLHHLLLYFAPMLASFWHDFGIKTWVVSIPIF